MACACVYNMEIGKLTVVTNEEAVTHILFGDHREAFGEERHMPLQERVREQLEEYFAGKRQQFQLPLDPEGTPFQVSVWKALCTIPYGETSSYGQIAALIGNRKACRAVGMANNRNPICIVVPCHRVIGADGSLVGYSGGLDVKKKLLALEAAHKIIL